METTTPNKPTPKGLKIFITVLLVSIALLSIGAKSYIAILFCIAGIIFTYDSLYLKLRPSAKPNTGNPLSFLCFFLALAFMMYGFINQENLSKAKSEAEAKAKTEAEYNALPDSTKERLQAEKAAEAEQKAIEKKVEKSFSGWNGSHQGLVKFVKSTMNDPSSFEHVSTTYNVYPATKTIIVFMSFRGKNSFGALVVNSIKAECDLDGNVLKVLEQ